MHNKTEDEIIQEIQTDSKSKRKKKIDTAIEEDINKTQEILGSVQKEESDLIKTFNLLNNPKNIESNTILNNKQVNALTLMNWASQVYEIDFFKYYVSTYPKYRISGDDGRGRKELIKIAESIRREEAEKHERLLEILRNR